MSDTSYDRFKHRYETGDQAVAYRDERFTRSRRWQRIDRREQAVVRNFLAGLPRGASVLDLPCGAGRLAPLAAEAGLRYTGADVALPMLALARKALGDDASLVAADAMALPMPDGAFDALVSVRLFHRIRERQARAAMLREMARVTAGPILVTYYLRWNLRGVRKWLSGKFPGLSRAEIAADARAAGLRVAQFIPLGRFTEQQCFVRLER